MNTYRLAPRYTPGSPATVTDSDLARLVAKEERAAYEHALAGRRGPRGRELAEIEGLSGIVEEVWPYRQGWQVRDLLTGERFYRP